MAMKQKQKNLLDRAAFSFEGCLTNPMEGLVLGNGDMAAVMTAAQHEVRFLLTKSDCWDARFDNDHDAHCLRHEDLVRWEKEYGFCWPSPVESDTPRPQWRENPEGLQVAYASPAFQDHLHGPNPKPMGKFIIRHNGLYGINIRGRLDLATGILSVDCDFGDGKLRIQAFIARKDNQLHIRLTKGGMVPKVQLILEKYPDNCAEMPLPEHHQAQERCAWMYQQIPAGCDVENFSWCLAANYPSIRENGYTRGSYRVYQKHKLDVLNFQSIRTSTLESDAPFDCVVAAATSRQVQDPIAAAKALACFDQEPDFETAAAAQREAMAAFWQRSGIWLEDEAAAVAWYRGIYSASVYIADNGTFPGVVCNIPIQDYSPFHGACVWNMNIQRWTVHAFATNHLEWIEAYTSWLEQNRELFSYFAKKNFGLEGIFPDFLTIPYVPAQRAYVNNKWGRSLSMLGWLMQPLWYYYEYTGDQEWLRSRAYPLLKEAAVFYLGFLKKYQKGPGGDVYPSMQIVEGPGWMPEFRGNRNLTDDLVTFSQTFRWAVEAARLLGMDEKLQQDWTWAQNALPPIHYTWDGEKGTVAFGYSNELGYTDDMPYYLSPYLQGKWPDKTEIPFPYETAALWMVYPFEYLTGDGESDLEQAAAYRIRNMYDYTCHQNPYNETHVSVPYGALLRVEGRKWYEHTIRTIEACTLGSGEYWMFSDTRTRLDSGTVGRMPETYVHPIQYLTDILLQTQGGLMRLFPALPRGKQASFHGFRARGGFFISAQTDGKHISAQIESALGGQCRVKLDSRRVLESPEGAWEESGVLCFQTQAGRSYTLTLEELQE